VPGCFRRPHSLETGRHCCAGVHRPLTWAGPNPAPLFPAGSTTSTGCIFSGPAPKSSTAGSALIARGANHTCLAERPEPQPQHPQGPAEPCVLAPICLATFAPAPGLTPVRARNVRSFPPNGWVRGRRIRFWKDADEPGGAQTAIRRAHLHWEGVPGDGDALP
jgi:hypothetical protein